MWIVKEMEKVNVIDFDTKDKKGGTLIEVARMNNNTAVSEYLLKTVCLNTLRIKWILILCILNLICKLSIIIPSGWFG